MSLSVTRALTVCLVSLAWPMAAWDSAPDFGGSRPTAAGADARSPSSAQSVAAQSGTPELTELKGPYFGQPRPGRRAVAFAEGFFAKSIYSSVSFSIDGSEAYWSTQGHMFWSRQVNGTWTKPEEIAINGLKGTCPVFSPDGKRLYFVTWANGEIAYVERTPNGWSETHHLPAIVNSTPFIHWNTSVDRQGNLYFASGRTNRDVKILHSPYRNGEYGQPAVIDELKDAATICPYVAPDGSYLIFVMTDPDKADKGLFIVFKKKDGGWGTPRSITEIVGGTGFTPTVSPDGKYLFFFDRGTMYWADASFIEDLRKQELK